MFHISMFNCNIWGGNVLTEPQSALPTCRMTVTGCGSSVSSTWDSQRICSCCWMTVCFGTTCSSFVNSWRSLEISHLLPDTPRLSPLCNANTLGCFTALSFKLKTVSGVFLGKRLPYSYLKDRYCKTGSRALEQRLNTLIRLRIQMDY